MDWRYWQCSLSVGKNAHAGKFMPAMFRQRPAGEGIVEQGTLRSEYFTLLLQGLQIFLHNRLLLELFDQFANLFADFILL